MVYIVVTGGVVSGLGKGVTTASIGKLLQSRGLKVTAVKIDPYLNLDAGTLRPTEHGEVWVTEDGGEIDQDLGHYERFLDITLSKEHNITTGQVYLEVIEKERKGEFLGQTVQPIPHLTDAIKNRIRSIAKKTGADVTLVEIGGVVGDYENVLYLEAVRQMKLEGEKVVFVHVSYLPVVETVGEMKSKPTQHSVKELREIGIQPDFIVCRSDQPVDDVRKKKIALFCNVLENEIISNPNLKNIYELPLRLEKQKFGEKIVGKLGIRTGREELRTWRTFVDNLNDGGKRVTIGIIGKYFDIGEYRLPDSYVSVMEAIKHACAANKVRPELKWVDSKLFEKNENELKTLNSFHGVIVPGGFGATGVEGKIEAIKSVRRNNIPFLGLCYGLQLAVIEFARNECGLEGANSSEIDPRSKHPVIDILPSQKKILKESRYGATMRLGGQVVEIRPDTLAYKLYGRRKITERFRHRYEINPKYVETLEEHGLTFSGKSAKEDIMQIGEITEHTFFIGTQFHPEYTSRPLRPNPIYVGFIEKCLGHT